MSLNDRAMLDPRWAFHARPVVAGAMIAVGVLYRVSMTALGVPVWNPFATDVGDREPGSMQLFTPIYEGRCRIQPNKDWRARKQNWKDETVTEHATRIQLDFRGNTLGTFPIVHVGDIFRVTEVLTLGGYPVDPQLTLMTHIVRNFTPTSNSWLRNLLCDTDMTQVDE